MTAVASRSLGCLPPPVLRPFVDRLWFYESTHPHPYDIILPSGDLQLLVSLEEPAEGLPHAIWTGPMTKPVRVSTAAMRRIVGVCFRPGGARPFLGRPATELTNLDVGISELWGRDGEVLYDRLMACRDPQSILTELGRVLLERFDQRDPPEPGFEAALRGLAKGGRVTQMADALGWSVATMRRRFHDRLGLSPKQHASLVRFQRAVQALARGQDNLADVALGAGYFDQAHLTHDFGRYAGCSPGAYRPRDPTEPNHVDPERFLQSQTLG